MPTKKLVWPKHSQLDIAGIIDYIAFHDSANKASAVFEKMMGKADGVIEFPSKGRIVPELREIGVHDFLEQIQAPYRLIYREHENHIVVVAVLDGRRDLGEILIQRALM